MKMIFSIKQLMIKLGLISEKGFMLKMSSPRLLLFIFLPAILILGGIVGVSILYQIPISMLTRDVTAIARIHSVSGALSNLGVLLWCVAATTAAFAAFILRMVKERERYLFLFYSFLLSAYLMLDDLFLIREDLGDKVGLNENVIYVLLGIAVFSYLVYFVKIIFQTDIIIFLIAFAFLSSSLILDKIGVQWLGWQLGDWKYMLEDVTKWIGIVFWCSYYVHTSFYFTSRIVNVRDIEKSDFPSEV